MIILFGLAGSGKSTQGKRMAEMLGMEWISVGEVLRESGRFDEILARGGLVNDDDVISLMNERVFAVREEEKDVVLDGFPRDIYQAEWVAKNWANEISEAYFLEVPKEELLKRLGGRGRNDDTEEVILERFRVVEENIAGILEILGKEKVNTEKISGVGEITEVSERLMAKIDENKVKNMRAGGKILHAVFEGLKEQVKPGVTGRELDAWVRKAIVARGGGVAYDRLPRKEAFPGAVCISVNDTLVHGVPKNEKLREGDKVSFDLDVYYKGYYTDSAFTMIVGDEGAASPAVRKMLSVTESAMWEGIEQVRAGVHMGDIGYAVEKVLRAGRLGVIENYIGHGIGRGMHEEPEVPNYGKRGRGYVLKEGDVICIEPMSCLGRPKNYVDKNDGWSVKIKDRSVACHFEHTVLVTATGYEVLT